MGRWLKEPLLHFLVLGALIFLVYQGMAGPGPSRDQIFISKGQQENLLNTFTRTWQRAPTPDEFQGLLRDYIRQEIAYRESTSMGLDQDDIVIRQRLRQKLELLTEDIASLAAPTDADLQQYLENHADDFLIEPRLSLRQIYFSRDRRGDGAERDARDLLLRIDTVAVETDPHSLGDPLPLPAEMTGLRESEVSRYFGEVFTDGLAGLEPGRWGGPVESGFGLHLVIIDERVPAWAPELEEVRESVQREWSSQRRQEAVDGLYDRLAENYTIEIEPLVAAPESGNQ